MNAEQYTSINAKLQGVMDKINIIYPDTLDKHKPRLRDIKRFLNVVQQELLDLLED